MESKDVHEQVKKGNSRMPYLKYISSLPAFDNIESE